MPGKPGRVGYRNAGGYERGREGIGLALDLKDHRMFVTDFGGSVYSANLDGSDQRILLFAQGNLTGIAYAADLTDLKKGSIP